jgi:hypothetical protein
MDERFIKRLMASIKCGVCGQPYKKANIKVIGHQEDFWFLNVHCSTCQSHALVAAVVREDTAPEIVTDLTEKLTIRHINREGEERSLHLFS